MKHRIYWLVLIATFAFSLLALWQASTTHKYRYVSIMRNNNQPMTFDTKSGCYYMDQDFSSNKNNVGHAVEFCPKP